MLADAISGSLDYAYLFAGISFILAGAAATALQRPGMYGPAWRWLAAFFFTLLFAELEEAVSLAYPYSWDSGVVIWLCFSLGSVMLYEFACKLAAPLGVVLPRRNVYCLQWVLGVGIFLIGGDLTELLSRAILFLPGPLVASYFLVRHARKGLLLQRHAVFVGLTLTAIFGLAILDARTFFSYPVTDILLLPRGPHAWMNAALAILLALLSWSMLRAARRRKTPVPTAELCDRYEARLGGFLLILLLSGGLVLEGVGRWREDEMHYEILQRTQMAAVMINRQAVNQLRWNPEDLKSSVYRDLKVRLTELLRSDRELRFVSLVGFKNGRTYVLVDSEPLQSKDAFLPGQWYQEADPEYIMRIAARERFVMGPLTDRRGTWMTGAVPVNPSDLSSFPVALTLDIDATHWAAKVFIARLSVFFIVFLLALLILVLGIAFLRTRLAAFRQGALLERIGRQQSAIVKIATSSLSAVGDFLPVLREISGIAAKATETDRVDIWIICPDGLRFECLSRDASADGSVRRGRLLSWEDAPHFFDLLGVGRAISSANVLDDDRLAELRPSYLRPEAVRALLAAPVRYQGKIKGFVCLLGLGAPREWTEDEERFAGEVGDQVAQALANRDHRSEADEKQNLEIRLLEAQRRESLGVLAGGIAHDFNNLLTVILGNAEEARLNSPAGTPNAVYLKAVVDASNKAAQLCRQMLAYSGRMRLVMASVDLSRFGREMAPMMDVALGRKTLVAYSFAEKLPLVKADAAQLQQAILNLCINAFESMESGEARARVSTGVLRCDAAFLQGCVLKDNLKPGDYVFFEVEDTGCGMDKETTRRIFDPFFSTKFQGRGLGLAAVLGIVRSHEGTIRVESTVGKGTRFQLLLPALPSEAQAGQPELPFNRQLRTGTVLVVDDDAHVREITSLMLRGGGLDVMLAPSGREAIALLSHAPERVFCALIDVTMPEMDGPTTAVELRKLKPDLAVLYYSGFARDDVLDVSTLQGRTGYLEKPFSRTKLLAALEKFLPKSA